MNLLRPKIADARGNRLPLLSPVDVAWRRRGWEVRRRMDSTEVWTRRNVAIMAAVSLPVVASGLTIPAILYFKLPMWLLYAAVLPLGALPAVSFVLAEQWMFARRYRDALIGAGLCPSCGYDLAAAPVEPDDSRVCPECGGAWKLP